VTRPTTGGIKQQQVKHWDAVADGWDAWLDWTERNFAAFTDWFIQAAGWTPGLRALDVGCGAGYPALIGAAHLRPGGIQVATDISPAMVAIVSRRAHIAGLRNIECLRMDAEDLRLPDASVDAVTNAYGLMFCPDPRRALDEAWRVLAPGGRVALPTWDDPSKNPFFTVITGIAAPMLSLTVPVAGAPGPFKLAEAPVLESMLRASGFSDVRVESRSATFELASVAEYVQIFSDVAWKHRIAALAESERRRLEEALTRAVQPFVQERGLRLPATSLCASGLKG
jgi:ubiquinone/menaquinone biosynthesis C-methylase UbiE